MTTTPLGWASIFQPTPLQQAIDELKLGLAKSENIDAPFTKGAIEETIKYLETLYQKNLK